MSAAPWGEAHRREARAFALLHASRLCAAGEDDWRAVEIADHFCESEERYRDGLSYVRSFGPNKAIDAAVARVRALAEGRLVRDVVWRRERDGDLFSDAHLARGGVEQPVTRVIRIRRA